MLKGRKILGYCIAFSPPLVIMAVVIWNWGLMTTLVLSGATVAAAGCILIWMWGIGVVVEKD